MNTEQAQRSHHSAYFSHYALIVSVTPLRGITSDFINDISPPIVALGAFANTHFQAPVTSPGASRAMANSVHSADWQTVNRQRLNILRSIFPRIQGMGSHFVSAFFVLMLWGKLRQPFKAGVDGWREIKSLPLYINRHGYFVRVLQGHTAGATSRRLCLARQLSPELYEYKYNCLALLWSCIDIKSFKI
jgi:hypothetical protein